MLAEQIGVAHLVADDPRDFVERPVVGGHRHPVPLAPRLEDHQRQVILRADGALHFAVEDELERRRLEETRAFFEKWVGHRLHYDALSRPFSLILYRRAL